MITQEVQLALETEIVQWLKTSPTPDDILTYVSNLPEEDRSVLGNAGDVFAKFLIERKDKYFNDAGLDHFIETVDMSDQFQAIQNLANYSSTSVASSLIKKYPSLGAFTFPSDIHEWSKTFLSQLNSVLFLLTADRYSHARLYLQSVLTTIPAEKRSALDGVLRQLYLKEGDGLNNRRMLLQTDVEEWAAFYRGLGIFPEVECVRLSQTSAYFERNELNKQLLAVLAITENEANDADLSLLERALWNLLQQEVLTRLLARAEGLRISEQDRGELLKSIYARLNSIWVIQNIQAGMAEGQTRLVVQEAEAQGITLDLADYLQECLTIEGLLDPVDPRVVIDNIATAATKAEAEAYISQLLSSGAVASEDVELVRSMLRSVISLLIKQ